MRIRSMRSALVAGMVLLPALYASPLRAGIAVTTDDRSDTVESLPGLIPTQTDTATTGAPFVDALAKSATGSSGAETVGAAQNSSYTINSGLLSLGTTESASEVGTFTTGTSDGKSMLSITFTIGGTGSYSATGTLTTPTSLQDDFVELKLSGPSGNVFDSISNDGSGPASLSQSGPLAAGTYTLLADVTAGGGGGTETADASLNFSAQQTGPNSGGGTGPGSGSGTSAVPLPAASLMGLSLLIPLALLSRIMPKFCRS